MPLLYQNLIHLCRAQSFYKNSFYLSMFTTCTMAHENQLIIELRNGNHKAFRELYERYKTRVYSFILNLVLSHDETEEIFQHVFVKVWENRANIKPDLSFNAYVYAIARNEVYSFWRRCMSRRQAENYLNENTDKQSEQMEEHIINKDFQVYLSSLVELLPGRCKEIFIMRYIQGLSYREIAEELRISESTVDKQLQKALTFVRHKMRKEFPMIIATAGYLLANL